MTNRGKIVGTPEWCAQTGGKLSLPEKLTYLAQGLWGSFEVTVPFLRWAVTGWHRPDSPMPEPTPPTSAVCVAAHSLCSELSPEFMVHHCVRTYTYARLLGEHWGLAFDDEALWVSGMLHDIALMPGWTDRSESEHCFTIPSGRQARKLCENAGWEPERAYKAESAITLNPNTSVPQTLGIEAHLLNLGVLVDATGLRLWEFHPEEVEALLERSPRQGMKSKIVGYVHTEADAYPGCRFHFSRRYLRFADLAKLAPFEE